MTLRVNLKWIESSGTTNPSIIQLVEGFGTEPEK
jgi:hypothetical protein